MSEYGTSDKDGEKVVLRMLSLPELRGYKRWSADETSKGIPGKFQDRVKEVFSSSTPLPPSQAPKDEGAPLPDTDMAVTVLPAVGVVAVAAVAGFVIDFVKTTIERIKDKYERQFGTATYEGSYWEEGVPLWRGFELLRYTDKFSKDDPAFHFICAIAVNKTDPRFFLLKPMFFRTKSAKAKVSGEEKITTKFDIAIDGTWIDKKNEVKQGRIAAASWEVSGYEMKEHAAMYFSKDGDREVVAGWFAGVPTSYLPKLEEWATSGGPFKLTVMVTERDEGKAAQILEFTAKLIGENKEKVITAVKGAVE